MITIDFPISANYVKRWGVWEAIREILQNAMDAHEQGYEMDVTFDVLDTALAVRNRNVKLSRHALLLGESSKGQNSRGQYGEGLKLALLVLVRAGYAIDLHTGNEIWEPSLRVHQDLDIETLHVDILEIDCVETSTVVFIQHKNMDADMIRMRAPGAFDPDGYPKTAQRVAYGNPGDIFCKGLWVENIAGVNHAYELPNVSLDRDRACVRRQDLSTGLGLAFDRLSDEEFFDTLMNPDDASADVFMYPMFHHIDRAKRLFRSRYDVEFLPADTEELAEQIRFYGYTPVPVSPIAMKVFRQANLTVVESLHRQPSAIISEIVDFDPYSKAMVEKYQIMASTDERLGAKIGSCTVKCARFKDRSLGLKHGDTVYIAEKACSDPVQLVRVLLHEFAHLDESLDGSVQHQRNIELLAAHLVVNASLVLA